MKKFLSRKFKNDGYFGISIIMIAITVALYLFLKFPIIPDAKIIEYFSLDPMLIMSKFYFWTIFTFQMIGRDPISLLFNSIFILWCGIFIEKTLGSKEFLLFYFLLCIFSFILIFLFHFLPIIEFKLPFFGSHALIMALLTLFSTYQYNSKILFMFIIPINAPMILLIILALDILNIVMTDYGFQHLLLDFLGFVYACLYMKLRLRKNLKLLFKNMFGIT